MFQTTNQIMSRLCLHVLLFGFIWSVSSAHVFRLQQNDENCRGTEGHGDAFPGILGGGSHHCSQDVGAHHDFSANAWRIAGPGRSWRRLKYGEIWYDSVTGYVFCFFLVYFCLLSLLCFFSVRSLNGECTRLNLEKKTMGSTSMGKTLLHAIDQVKYSTQRESLPLL